MAEDTTDDAKRSKRRLRVVSTETVRERTEKLQAQSNVERSPSRIKAFFGGFFWPLRALGRQIAKLGRFRVFRWIGVVFLPPYVRNSWRELRQVTWPTGRETFQLTNAVIVFSLVFGLIVFVVDIGLDKLFKEFILK